MKTAKCEMSCGKMKKRNQDRDRGERFRERKLRAVMLSGTEMEQLERTVVSRMSKHGRL